MINNKKNAIKELNKIFLESLLKNMTNKGVDSLYEEVSTKVNENGFTIFSSPAVIYANYGRNPGKMPAMDDLRPWLKKNNIPIKALFPIAKKIGEKGTDGLDFIPDFNKETQESMNIIAEATIEEIQSVLNDLNNRNNNK